MAPRREDLGSWLEGTPGEPSPSRGSGLGLPPRGPGSLATLGRRVLALMVDWLLSLAVASQLFPDASAPAPGLLAADPTATLAIFALSTTLLVATLGTSVGHRLLGLRVLRVRDLPAPATSPGPASGSAPDAVTGPPGPAAVRPPGLVAALVRTVLLCLVIPPVVWDREGRGMHDAAAGTVLVRR